jgi:16S rRNA (adenine1518-N6/adenine1519-N6)-dimethyltransferase
MPAQQNLTSPAVIKSILLQHGLRPKKRLGQNFLIDRNVLNKIIDAAELGPDVSALEIGPGLGVVTRELAMRAGHVVAVEADRELIPILNDVLADMPNAQVVNADFLRLDLDQFLTEHFGKSKIAVVANLPYYITTPIITELIAVKERINHIVLMVQREVAQRLSAPPGGGDYGSITVFVRYHCELETMAQVSRNVFFPPPEVDSSLIKLTIRPEPPVQVKDESLFFAVVHAAFGKRRKTLLNALADAPGLALTKSEVEGVLIVAGIDPTRRGETLDLPEFAAIADLLFELIRLH